MDRRTKRQKLKAMADQSVSPEEAKIAAEKLKSLPPDPPQRQGVFFTLRIVGPDGQMTVFTVGDN